MTNEGFDKEGQYFVEFDYEKNCDSNVPDTFLEIKESNFQIVEPKNIDREIHEGEILLKNSFHLFLYGLDIDNYNTYELTEEIYNEIKNHIGKINRENIKIIDENSLISIFVIKIDFVVNNLPNFKNYDKLIKFGRFATVKLNSEKDALKLLLEHVAINVPLVDNRKGKFFIFQN